MKTGRIVHITKYYTPFAGGMEETAKNLALCLKDNYEQLVVCFNHNKGTVREIVDGIEVWRCGVQVKISSQPISISLISQLRKSIKEFAPDFVVLHYPNPYATTFLLGLLHRDVKFIVYWHMELYKQKLLMKVFHKQTVRLLMCASKIVALTPVAVETSPYLSRFKSRCAVIPTPINDKRFELTEGVGEKAKKIRDKHGNKTICFAYGRHVEYKGFDYLIEASMYLDDSFIFIIAGDGPLTQDLKSKAAGNERIVFPGLIDNDTLKAHLIATDIFCFPSITKNESYGLSLVEAMYFGKPAVTFNIEGSGVNYVSINELTGIECPNRDSKTYAEAIRKLALNKQLREQYGHNAKERVRNNFLLQQYSEKINDLFSTVV